MVVLKKLILTVYTLGRYGSHERSDFNSFYFGKVWQFEKLNLTVSTLQGCCDSESPGFNSFYFGRV